MGISDLRIVTASSCSKDSATLRVISCPISSGANTGVIAFNPKRIWNKKLELLLEVRRKIRA